MGETKPVWEEYMGKEVILQYGGGIVFGKMNIDLERNCIDFIPYMSYEANGKNVRLETKTPRRISLNIFGTDKSWDIQTLLNGDLEKKVETINSEVGSSRGPMGFGQN